MERVSILRTSLLFLLAAGLASPQAPAPGPILKGVEKRYNSMQSLEAAFTQTYFEGGRTRSVKKGTLYLNKKKTRWQYSMPAGDWFLSDGNYAYNYESAKRAVERMKLKETDDMRIPLGFLVGTLDFDKHFGKYETRQDGANVQIKAIPKRDDLLFSAVTMWIGPDSSLKRISITGQNASVMDFVLEGEKRNVPVNASLFTFKLPAGATLIESGE